MLSESLQLWNLNFSSEFQIQKNFDLFYNLSYNSNQSIRGLFKGNAHESNVPRN